jgi:hypothetical protein
MLLCLRDIPASSFPPLISSILPCALLLFLLLCSHRLVGNCRIVRLSVTADTRVGTTFGCFTSLVRVAHTARIFSCSLRSRNIELDVACNLAPSTKLLVCTSKGDIPRLSTLLYRQAVDRLEITRGFLTGKRPSSLLPVQWQPLLVMAVKISITVVGGTPFVEASSTFNACPPLNLVSID